MPLLVLPSAFARSSRAQAGETGAGTSGWKRFPPRLPEQPIFYPVVEEEYAIRIARDWNVKASGVGYVTKFDVDAGWLSEFPCRKQGGAITLSIGFRRSVWTSSMRTSSGRFRSSTSFADGGPRSPLAIWSAEEHPDMGAHVPETW